ncbi:MAG: hypothetical protein DMG50_23585 [Acidobacteria bacterium]|nr:MAG: hypothetical protein DMG50_23585 [Acidobacteriota bacterium]
MQLEFRQRFSHGSTLNVNYTWSHSLTDRYNKAVDNTSNFTTLRDLGLDRGPSPFDIRHVVQAFGTYDLPFGKGRRFSVNNAFVDRVAGGWTVGSIFRFQTGLPFRLSSGQLTVNQQDSGVVANIPVAQLQGMVGVFKPATIGSGVFYVNPSLVGSNGQANPSDLALPTIPGQFGSFIYLHGPRFVSDDLSIAKQMPIIGERLRIEIRAEMLNAFLWHKSDQHCLEQLWADEHNNEYPTAGSVPRAIHVLAPALQLEWCGSGSGKSRDVSQ